MSASSLATGAANFGQGCSKGGPHFLSEDSKWKLKFAGTKGLREFTATFGGLVGCQSRDLAQNGVAIGLKRAPSKRHRPQGSSTPVGHWLEKEEPNNATALNGDNWPQQIWAVPFLIPCQECLTCGLSETPPLNQLKILKHLNGWLGATTKGQKVDSGNGIIRGSINRF